jgi:RHS repeat-associated protein
MMFGASNGSTFTIDNFKIIGAQQIRTFDCSGDNYLAINYRYGFNGKELDTETNTYDYGFRIYSGPLGKFLSVDPLYQSYPELTTYQFASNTPIWAVDLDGLEAEQHTYFYQIHEETGELQQVGFCNEIYTGVKRHGDKGALVDKYLWVVPEEGVYVPEPKPSVWEKVAKKVEDAVWNTNDYINEKMSWAKTLYIAVEGKGQAAASTTSPIGGVEGSGAVKSTSYVYASEGQGNQSENLGAASKLETETVVSLSTDKGKVASLSFKPGIFIGFSNQLKMSSKEGDVSTKSFTQIQVGPFIYKSNNGIGSDSKDVQIGGNFSLGLKYQTGAKVNQTIFTNDYSINPNNQESFNNDSCE